MATGLLPDRQRRQCLAMLGAIGTSALLPRPCRAASADFSVAVIGAGMAGLYAACLLENAGIAVCVLEANSRLGGRNWTLRPDDTVPDIFGEEQRCGFSPDQHVNAGPWRLLPGHRRALALVDQLGLNIKPLHGGDGVYLQQGMDALPQTLARRLRQPVRTGCAVSRIETTGAKEALNIHYHQGQTRKQLTADFAIIALPANRLNTVEWQLHSKNTRNLLAQLNAIEVADALKLAYELPSPPSERPARDNDNHTDNDNDTGTDSWRIIWPSDEHRIVAIYANQQAIKQQFQPSRQSQILRGAQLLNASLPTLKTRHGLAVQWSRVPLIEAAAARLPLQSVQQLVVGQPPLFFAGDALSSLNGWQEGALESAEKAVSALLKHAGLRTR